MTEPFREMFAGSHLLSTIADLVSILSFAISVWVALTLKQIRRQFLFQARLPELLKSLKNHANRIAELVGSYDENRHAIDAVIAQTHSTLVNIEAKIRGMTRESAATLIRTIDGRSQPVTRDETWRIYTALQGFIEGIQHLQKDTRWR
jgi:hypothetical protein